MIFVYMTIIALSDYLIDLDKILSKKINRINFQDIISLIFHAIEKIGHDFPEWKILYIQFQKEFDKQNELKWPRLSVNRNDYSKRMDIFCHDVYIVSNNLLTLLLRLLYMENYKRGYTLRSYHYHKILGKTFPLEKRVEEYSLWQLFELLDKCLTYYLEIYDDESRIENRLADKIVGLIK